MEISLTEGIWLGYRDQCTHTTITPNPEQLPFSLRIHAAWRLFPSSPIPHLPTPPLGFQHLDFWFLLVFFFSGVWLTGFGFLIISFVSH